MAQTKQQKQQKALEKLTANIADRLAKGQAVTFSKQMEYNNLKRALGLSGTIDIAEPSIPRRDVTEAQTPSILIKKIGGFSIWINDVTAKFVVVNDFTDRSLDHFDTYQEAENLANKEVMCQNMGC